MRRLQGRHLGRFVPAMPFGWTDRVRQRVTARARRATRTARTLERASPAPSATSCRRAGIRTATSCTTVSRSLRRRRRPSARAPGSRSIPPIALVRRRGMARHAATSTVTVPCFTTAAAPRSRRAGTIATPPGGCTRCHGDPPPTPSHARTDCATCHPASAPHIDGIVQVGRTPGCSGCHGSTARRRRRPISRATRSRPRSASVRTRHIYKLRRGSLLQSPARPVTPCRRRSTRQATSTRRRRS